MVEKKRATLLLLAFILVSFNSKAGISVINGLLHSYKVQKGDVIEGYIEIQNTGSDEQHVLVSKNDFLCNSEGQAFYNKPVMHDRSNASWIELKSTYIVLAPNEKYQLIYQVKVPGELYKPGSYWGVIMVEPTNEIKPEPSMGKVNVMTRIRYAIQVVCTVEAEAKPEVRFKDTKVESINGRRYLIVDIEDIGELFHIVVVKAEFFETFNGTSVGKYKSEAQTIFPYTSRRFMIDITGLEEGSYKGVLLADCSNDQVFGLNLMLEIGDE